jgi:predicted DNA-binding transcriptional regulator AlpA
MQRKVTQFVRWPGLKRLFDDSISRSTIDRWEKAKLFPARVRIGKNSVAWNLAAIEQWIKERSEEINK